MMSDAAKLDAILSSVSSLQTDVDWLKKCADAPPKVSTDNITISLRWFTVSLVMTATYFGSLGGTYYTFKAEATDMKKYLTNVERSVEGLSSKFEAHIQQHLGTK